MVVSMKLQLEFKGHLYSIQKIEFIKQGAEMFSVEFHSPRGIRSVSYINERYFHRNLQKNLPPVLFMCIASDVPEITDQYLKGRRRYVSNFLSLSLVTYMRGCQNIDQHEIDTYTCLVGRFGIEKSIAESLSNPAVRTLKFAVIGDCLSLYTEILKALKSGALRTPLES